MHTAGLAVYLLKWHRGAADLLRHAIWVGGDVDSLGAICLGILGGAEGLGFVSEDGLSVLAGGWARMVWGLLRRAFPRRLPRP